MANRLARATSPYLRSHAENPVDWYEWSAEAFDTAKERGVPVLVSIGYSTCHWCHVMARESFSDPALAAYLNENFVAIKVDREEYPDVDASYLAAASAFTADLGWPLTVFVTPTGGPFFAGTYWPPEPIAGHPAFRQVLRAVLDAWNNRRDEVEQNAAGIATALAGYERPAGGTLPTDFAPFVERLASYEDLEFGGFGTAPKFPVATALSFLLGRGELGDEAAGDLARRTLDAMAASPLRDPIEGGFFRYATKRDWSEPHYERMLYDNALLLGCYARAGRPAIAEGVAGFLLEHLRVGPVFASAQDSESTVDGARVEGGYYALSAAERASQTPPALDEKVLTGWNGLAIENLALAGTLLDRPSWVAAARDAADYLLERHVGAALARTSIDGQLSSAPATLEDYGMLASALLQLALSTGEARYAIAARELVDGCLPGFAAPGGPEPLLARLGLALETDPSEGAYPSGISALAAAAHRLWLLTANARYRVAAEEATAALAELASDQPMSFGAALSVMSGLAADAEQLVVVADSSTELMARSKPGSIVTIVTSDQARAFESAGFELYEGRTAIDGRPTAYACREFVCALPVFEFSQLGA